MHIAVHNAIANFYCAYQASYLLSQSYALTIKLWEKLYTVASYM